MKPQLRRRLILDRSAEVFAAKGVTATTIRELGAACGVQSGALYHYFPSKEAIVTELIREYVTDLAERCRVVVARDLAPIPRLRALAEVALTIGADYPEATVIWQRESDYMRARLVEAGFAPLADSMIEAWRIAVSDGVAGGDLRRDLDPVAVQELLQDAVWHTGRWNTGERARTASELADLVIEIFVEGMRAR